MNQNDIINNLTIIIPTLNEGANISILIDKLTSLYNGINIIVSDDGSTDDTQEVVLAKKDRNPKINLIDRSSEEFKGITASVLSAFKVLSTKYFLVMDGDLQHPPESVIKLIDKLSQGSQIVIAERSPYVERQGLHRVLITKCATWVAQAYLLLKGFYVSDPMAGFFGGDMEYVNSHISNRSKRFEPQGYKILFDLLRILPRTTKISRVSYDFAMRPGGESKLRPAHAWYFFKSLFK